MIRSYVIWQRQASNNILTSTIEKRSESIDLAKKTKIINI
jgi:hypothetical protein